MDSRKTKSEHPENAGAFPGLRVNSGIEKPPVLNPGFSKRKKAGKPGAEPAGYYSDGILAGDRMILSRAITLVESARADHQEKAREIIHNCLPHSGNSMRIGITGVPGVGKSSFIETLGTHLTNQGHRLAVLAIDPSSERSKGSILGDKTRMEKLAVDPLAYVRPSPSGGSLGGVARTTRETIILCEAAGFDVLFIETVGVGQSEIAVHSMVDFFLLLMLAGAGDELQGIKRGIMEMADGIAITKADGTNLEKAQLARIQYENALHLFPPSDSGWIPKAGICSSLTGFHIPELWEMIGSYFQFAEEKGFLSEKRRHQARFWMHETIHQSLVDSFFRHPLIKQQLPRMEKEVQEGKLSSFQAASTLLELFRNQQVSPD